MAFKTKINLNVFLGSSLLILGITLYACAYPVNAEAFFTAIQSWLIKNTSWVYILFVGNILFFSIYLLASRYGDIKLGPDHSEPEYGNYSWFAMLFSAGMGVGLMFWGVAEPIMHFSDPPVGVGATVESAREAMKITFFHWGLHAWAIYAIFAIILAYFSFRKNLPLLPRSAGYPFLGEKIYGPFGDIIDGACIVGTLFGVAASLGMGATQVNSGLDYLWGIGFSIQHQVVLIILITLFATTSVVLGLDKGIKNLSNINITLAIFLSVAVLLLGETNFLLKSFVQNTGAYFSDIIYKTFNLYSYEHKTKWIGGWTLLYWGWWISWSPFVGMFIARISKGRTIREFILGVLCIPTGFTFFWMTAFGNSAIHLVLEGKEQALAQAVNSNVPISLFKFFEYFPYSSAFSFLAVVLIITFFVSSSDSGSFVIDTLASGGEKEPPVWQRIYWAFMEGLVAAILLLYGGLQALQTMAIASAFPMLILMTFGIVAFIKSLREDYLLVNSVQLHNPTVQYTQKTTSWRERLNQLTHIPTKREMIPFLHETVHKALVELSVELIHKGYDVKVHFDPRSLVRLVIQNGPVEDFSYGVRLRTFNTPTFTVEEDADHYCRAEVFLLQGGQDYDVYGYSREQIIADFITQFEKHLHYLHLNYGEKR